MPKRKIKHTLEEEEEFQRRRCKKKQRINIVAIKLQKYQIMYQNQLITKIILFVLLVQYVIIV